MLEVGDLVSLVALVVAAGASARAPLPFMEVWRYWWGGVEGEEEEGDDAEEQKLVPLLTLLG